ncbi:membrane protein [Alteromonas sp. KUL42]|uniref:mechanosensitive ion channel family protein n=1 Tax=Alteromonas sp. KUL42 TaxID=2480797 RepID=UPI0010369192|nr:mechanosensitive ion channel family protein [Alteromonas sp. KUL42]TAP30036.1 mechanosensitive ion channel family protein [Alteromonas sp. KUL42]GEA09609.1 membrane protein [Alteromonas sp. KUL42]
MEMSTSIRDRFTQLVQELLPSLAPEDPLYNVIALSSILAFSAVVYIFARILIRPQIARFVSKSNNQWDNALQDHGFFRRLTHLVPALLIYTTTPILIGDEAVMHGIVIKCVQLYMLYTALLALYALLSTIEDVYNASALAKRAPITGFIQVTKLAFAIITILLSISLIVNKSPLLIVSGLTAIAAVLLLIFRDTILGFVAGIQIAANRMFNTGDWIAMPKYEVDGEILEIGLTNVKVQNWDKTISTLPTYSLTTEAVKNWRGMQESGGRRIKRAIYIDIHSVALCNNETLERFSKVRYINDYIEKKKDELRTYHKDYDIDESDLLNSRRLTNIGTFRAYLEAYLRKHPNINQDMTLMVRQLPPTELGLPLEIYCFSAQKEWVAYEKVQADIFDHVMAMLSLFDLRAYQRDGHLSLLNQREQSVFNASTTNKHSETDAKSDNGNEQ